MMSFGAASSPIFLNAFRISSERFTFLPPLAFRVALLLAMGHWSPYIHTYAPRSALHARYTLMTRISSQVVAENQRDIEQTEILAAPRQIGGAAAMIHAVRRDMFKLFIE